MDGSCHDFVPTRCSALKNIAVQYREVKFESHSKNKKQKLSVGSPLLNKTTGASSACSIDGPEFDIDCAKNEMRQFVRSYVKPSDRQSALRELAIKLGARPPRKTAENYKDILSKKKKEKVQKLEELDQVRKGKQTNIPLKKKTRDFDKARRTNILSIYGKAKVRLNRENMRRKIYK